jgi:acetyl-CoA C-acetyltransferase
MGQPVIAQLGALAVAEAIQRAGIAQDKVDEVLMGTVLQAGQGQNPARQAALGAGLPDTIAAVTVNKVCGSGLKTVMLAAQAIKAGDGRLLRRRRHGVDVERAVLPAQARAGQRLGHGQLIDGMVADGLWDVYNDFHMGMTGELVAEKYEVTRESKMDAWAAQSPRARWPRGRQVRRRAFRSK